MFKINILCFANFCLWLVPGFSHIAWPLNQLTKGNGSIVYKWTPKQYQDFEKLKHHIYVAPVLMLLDFHQSFEIEIDASDYALGTVIMQSSHPVIFHF